MTSHSVFSGQVSYRMKQFALLVTLLCVVATLSSAIPKPDDNGKEGHKNRVHERELSDQEHFKDMDEDEEGDDEHNPEYDHEAFLGKDEAGAFDNLTPEESKERLGAIYDKVDKDQDGFVTHEELKNWIKYVQQRYVSQDTERQWKEHEHEGDKLEWAVYKERTYGFVDENDEDGDDSYKQMMSRDKKRWEKADEDQDGKLTVEEFSNFLHPEEAEHMKAIVVEETLDDIDKDKDGYISLDEYIADMWPDSDDGSEPDWVKTEREQFANYRDKNGDGKMDREEVQDWILPTDYDHTEAEAKHLIHESDEDKDGKLTKEEVVEKYDLFVGSQATDFGEALTRHDEF